MSQACSSIHSPTRTRFILFFSLLHEHKGSDTPETKVAAGLFQPGSGPRSSLVSQLDPGSRPGLIELSSYKWEPVCGV